MINRPHIIILGGGLIGLSCADSLITGGARVTLVEKQAQTGHGAGRYNSGMVHPSQAAPWLFKGDKLSATKLVLKLAQRSSDLLQNRRHQLGCLDKNRSAGSLQLFDSIFAGQTVFESSNDLGIAVDIYRGAWGFQRYGLHYLNDISGDAFHYCQRLTEDLIERGCHIQYGQNAALNTAQNQCHGIEIDGQIIHSDHVIVACGAQSAEFLNAYGINLPVSAMKGHALSFERPVGISLPEIPIMHWDSRSALTVFENEVRLSGTIGEDNPDALLDIWEEIAPDIVNAFADPVVRWSADRPASKLGRPIIGQTPLSNLWVNSGHGHMGWSLCAASGGLMSQMILDGKAAPEFALPL